MPLVTKQFSDIITFSRASTATYTNSSGVLTSAASGFPRLDYDPVTLAAKGLLIEEQRTNLLTYSEQFDNAVWIKGDTTVSANATTAPDGTATADKLVEVAATAQHTVANIGVSMIASAGVSYSATCFVKAGERSYAFFGISGSAVGTAALISINLSTGAVATVLGSPTNSSATNAGNGWWRISVSATAITTGDVICDLRLSADGVWANRSYAGNATNGLYAWGAQLEAGAFPTSYIPTTSAQVTRAADVAVIDGTRFSNWYRQDEGTLFVEFGQTPTVSGNYGLLTIDDSTTNNFIRNFAGAGTQAVMDVTVGTVNQVYINTGGVITPSADNKIASGYKVNDFARSLNGNAASTDTAGNVATTMSRMIIGNGYGGVVPLNGHIKRIAFYPRRLSNSELQALTA